MQRRQNALAINSIQRQVNRLKAVDYGPVQYQCQRMSEQFCSGHIGSDEASDPGLSVVDNPDRVWVEVRKDRPLLFDATDFTCAEKFEDQQGSAWQHKYRKLGCRIWSTRPVGSFGNMGILRRACWQIPPHMPADPFWKKSCEQNIRGDYRTVFANYEFQVRGSPVLQNTKVTFTVLTLKAKATNSSLLFRDGVHQTTDTTQDGLLDSVNRTWLPDCLPALSRITENDHKLNQEYFKIWTQKSVYINSQYKGAPDVSAHSTTAGMAHDDSGQWTQMAGNQLRGGYTTSNIKTVKFNFTPKKVYKRIVDPMSPQFEHNQEKDLSNSITSSALGMPTSESFVNVVEYEGGDFGPYTLPVDKPLWLLITTDDVAVTTEDGHIATSDQPIHDNKVQVRGTRYVKWRDEHDGRTFSY